MDTTSARCSTSSASSSLSDFGRLSYRSTIQTHAPLEDLLEFREASRQYLEHGTLWIRYSVTP